MLWSPITPHTDIPFARLLEDATGIPVTVENDCNMIAMALRSHDPERYRNDFIAILLSQGIGMGMVLRGELFTGTQSSGGEFGHMIHRPDGALCRCGRRGCVEAYAGNYAIWRNAHGMPEDSPPVADISDADIAKLADEARRENGPEREAFRKAGEALGFALGSLFALIDPAPVAMVGHGALAFDLLEPPIREAIAKTAGGQHSKAISFDTEPNEMPLIREGCAVRALAFLDEQIFAPGINAAVFGWEDVGSRRRSGVQHAGRPVRLLLPRGIVRPGALRWRRNAARCRRSFTSAPTAAPACHARACRSCRRRRPANRRCCRPARSRAARLGCFAQPEVPPAQLAAGMAAADGDLAAHDCRSVASYLEPGADGVDGWGRLAAI